MTTPTSFNRRRFLQSGALAMAAPCILPASAFGLERTIAPSERTVLEGAGADNRREDEANFRPLFDGKGLDGWEGNQDIFQVKEGAIVGGSLQRDIPRNEFLCTTREYGDFELRLQFKILGKGANAGVQLRSKRIPNHHEVIGYQADLGDQWWGCLYDESRRRKVLAGPEPNARGKPIRPNKWNDYRIRCQAEQIQLWINGTQTVDYREPDPKIERKGIIGLQVHSGGPMEAWYRKIRIRELTR